MTYIPHVMVTGAAGFIGHHLVEHLLKNTDWQIIVLDKLNYASSGLSRLQDTSVFKQMNSGNENRVVFYATDLSQPIPVGLAKELGGIDYIIHMAAETHVDNSISQPYPFVISNIVGTFHLLEFARTLNSSLKAFLFFSTDEVFGPASQRLPKVGPDVINDMLPPEGLCVNLHHAYKEWDRFNPTNPYSATKAAAEDLCLAWSNTYKIPMIITHTMNAFGERQHPEKFIPSTVRKLIKGETITVHASSDKKTSGSRFYIHCRNIADAVLFLLNNFRGDCIRDKFNIVGEKEITNLDLVNLIEKNLHKIMGPRCMGRTAIEMVDFHSSRPGHDLRYALDGMKMKNMGWEPPKNFEESLETTIRWMLQPQNIKWLLL